MVVDLSIAADPTLVVGSLERLVRFFSEIDHSQASAANRDVRAHE
jgi:hypothetical protein